MDKRKRITREDINVPASAHVVPKGYPVHMWDEMGWSMTCHVFAPIMPSPRPRVTTRGTFMPTEYRKHCSLLSVSLAYARGMHEAKVKTWDSSVPMHLDLAFWSPKMPGDLDNLAKTIMDSCQLHKNEKPGAELWLNDKQVQKLTIDWIETEEPEWWQTVVRIKPIEQSKKVRL